LSFCARSIYTASASRVVCLAISVSRIAVSLLCPWSEMTSNLANSSIRGAIAASEPHTAEAGAQILR